MSSTRPTYHVDEADPRAPAQEVWDAMSDEERARVLSELPSEFDALESAPPEGDLHFDARALAKETLQTYFRKTNRRVYLASEMAIYDPGEAMFAPDLMAVLDVDLHPRESWVVSAEKKGLDLALEIHVSGRRLKDLDRNVKWFARLGIPEYIVFDRKRLRLFGFRLPSPGSRVYERVLPQVGRLTSHVLGLDLLIEGDRLRFVHGGMAPVLDRSETIELLESMVRGLESRSEDAEERARAAQETIRRLEEEVARLRNQLEPRGNEPG
jgi:Uma2 family endonuclease